VHLGQGDTSLEVARQSLGVESIIGITCHDQLPLARAAQAAGADYVAFGRFFPSATKPQASSAPLTLIPRAQQEIDIPIVAIGGITRQNAAPLIQAGAQMLALVEGLFAQHDITTTARDFLRLFNPERDHEPLAL
jgi:thiamine-phosphate pyrophosphorylase